MGQAYVNFTRNCMDQIRSKVLDELWILTFFEVRIDKKTTEKNFTSNCNLSKESKESKEKLLLL